MLRACGVMLVAAAVLSIPVSAVLAVPLEVPYMGRLTTDAGGVVDGTVDVRVWLYPASSSGSPVWGPQVLPNTPVNGGILALVLQGGNPSLESALLTSNELWLQFEIDGEPMAGRQRVYSVPFALLAGDAESLGGLPASDYLTVGGTLSAGSDPSGCTAANAGAIRFQAGIFEGCNGTEWRRLDGATDSDLGGADNPAQNCQSILDANPAAPDGSYWLDPPGDGVGAFRAHCDMTTEGGGWTLVASVSASNANHYGSTGLTNPSTTEFPVPFEATQSGRKLSDLTVRGLAVEGVIRVEVARNLARITSGSSNFKYRTFFRMAGGMTAFSFGNQGGSGSAKIFTSHAYPFVWEEDGGGDGYHFGCNNQYKVFDNHNDCVAQWNSSQYTANRILYGYTGGGTANSYGIYGGSASFTGTLGENPGYTWGR